MHPFFFGGGSEILFMLMFCLVLGMFVVTALRGVSQWNKNNQSPRLSVEATVTGKRTSVQHHHHQNHTSHSTSYYVSFQVESGDRMEFHVSGQEYGMVMEGDTGRLHFQGTRYLGFVRA